MGRCGIASGGEIYMRLHAALVSGEEGVEATLHSLMTAMLAIPVLGRPQTTHMPFEDRIACYPL